MEKIQMPCTEEQFDRDLKPFLVDAGVVISSCKAFEQLLFIKTPYHNFKIGTGFESSNWETIDYNPKEFLKHLGIDIYDVGDVVKIGEYDCEVIKTIRGLYLTEKYSYFKEIFTQFGLKNTDLNFSNKPILGSFPYHTTLYDLNKTIQFLKSHEMQEKPFTLEQAKEMLAIESLKELAYKFYPELQSPVNDIDPDLIEKLSINMFGNAGTLQIANLPIIEMKRTDLKNKAFFIGIEIEPILHKKEQYTIIEFKNK